LQPPRFPFLNTFRNLRHRAALRAPDHPGYYEGILVSGSRVLASGAMFAGLALALGGGHLAIATLAALPALTRLAHLAVPELVRRHGSWAVAATACWLERGGFLCAAIFGILRPEGWAVQGFLAGIGFGFLGQNLYDASLAALHTEATPAGTFGRYTATKARWAAISGLVLGVLASVAVDTAERAVGVPPHIARALAVVAGVAVHLAVTLPLRRMRAVARALDLARARARGGPATGAIQTRGNHARLIVLPSTAEQWAVVKFALVWGSAVGVSMRQGEAMAISVLGVSVGMITLLNAILVGAGVLGAKMWGQLGDRFGGKGLMSIALLGLAVDPLWMLAALFVHPAFLIPSYALGGVFNSGWTIAQNMTLVRTTGHAADRIRVFAFYNVAFGLAAGTAPMVGGAILELLDTSYAATIAYGALFVLAAVMRLHAYQHLRTMPAPPAERGRYVSAVVLRAVRRSVVRRTRIVRRLGNAVGSTITSTISSTVATVIGAARGGV
jgi:Major Facilitator Superfamily